MVIRIGLKQSEKQKTLDDYLKNNKIKKVIVLYADKHESTYDFGGTEVEYVEWKDIIMYKFFYRLLEEINNEYLIVVDELMRTQNRSELTYNCAHHYLNQTEHKIVFEYFPFIESKNDFMILLDFIDKGKYKGRSFSYDLLAEKDVKIKPRKIELELLQLPTTSEQAEEYEKERDRLFDNLGNKDPDTIPRNLHVFVGKYKKNHLTDGEQYVARNQRFKMNNIRTYRQIDDRNKRKVIDFPHRRIDFNDFLKTSGQEKVTFLSTGLSVDNYYYTSFKEWLQRLGDFYGKASLSK